MKIVEEGYSRSTALSLMQTLAMNQTQAVTYKALSHDMAHGETGPDENTITSYLELFDRLFLTENLPGWEPPMRAKARVRVKPKRYFVDPSLGAALIGATPDRLLRDTQSLDMLFEALVLRDIRVLLSSYPGLGNTVSYYRDDKGLEVDLIIEHNSQWAGLEVKLSETKIDEAVISLQRLRAKVASNPAARNAEPVFLAVIVGKGNLAYTRPDGIHVIPASTLTA
ncbi:MAG: DUF4143 domain-containing protein [Propionibacteriaceae bacterium]|nr:DUF4143 domain-containing protein [Propionibacteriaceae bacterium]